MTINLTQFSKFAVKLAKASSKPILKHYRNFGELETKSDASPVTIADRQAEEVMRNLIAKKYPKHDIQGEEFGRTDKGSEFCWVLDPIDGTTSFMIGRPIFGTLICLLYQGRPVIGIINQPVTGELWLGVEGRPTTLNGKEIHSSNCNNLKDAILTTTAPHYYTAEKFKQFQQLSDKCKHTVWGGDCYNYGLLALGMVDIAIDSALKQHDFLPLVPIIKGAGGVITDWQGKELDLGSNGDVIISATIELHRQVLAGELGIKNTRN